jgi:hypothetical protein
MHFEPRIPIVSPQPTEQVQRPFLRAVDDHPMLVHTDFDRPHGSVLVVEYRKF